MTYTYKYFKEFPWQSHNSANIIILTVFVQIQNTSSIIEDNKYVIGLLRWNLPKNPGKVAKR